MNPCVRVGVAEPADIEQREVVKVMPLWEVLTTLIFSLRHSFTHGREIFHDVGNADV